MSSSSKSSSDHAIHPANKIGSIAAATASILLVIYILAFLQKSLKKSPDIPHIAVVSVSGAIIALSTQVGGNTHTISHVSYILFTLVGSLAGVVPVILTTILAFLALIFSSLSHGVTPGNSNTHLLEMVYVVIGMFSGLFGWSLIRKKYMLPNNVNAITDMLSQEKFKSTVILESITDGVMVMNIKGTVQIMNESAATMLGWTREEAIHLDYRSLIKSSAGANESAQTAIDLCLKTQKSAHQISLIEVKGSKPSYFDIVASPVFKTTKNDDGTTNQVSIGVIAVLRNVDEQKREEEQRSDFISTASHEMRTPVASIQGFIELALNSKVSTIDAKARGYLEKAHLATKQLGSLFQDLLTVSKSEDGRLSNNPKLIEVGELLKTAVEQARMAAEKKQLKINLETGTGDSKVIAPLLYVNVDPDRLREVILNLLDNAIKYTASGIITVGTSLKETSVIIRVSDTGMGIAPEDLPHLFQKFYRTDNTATREIGGTGLGLYICKQIIDMMSGKIWVESTVGAGSTFYVEIPRISPERIAAINMANNPSVIKTQEV